MGVLKGLSLGMALPIMVLELLIQSQMPCMGFQDDLSLAVSGWHSQLICMHLWGSGRIWNLEAGTGIQIPAPPLSVL